MSSLEYEKKIEKGDGEWLLLLTFLTNVVRRLPDIDYEFDFSTENLA